MMANLSLVCCFLLVVLCHGGDRSINAGNLEIVIMSQHNSYHIHRAMDMAQSLELQNKDFRLGYPKIHLMHDHWPSHGPWTILPMIPDLSESGDKHKWVIFVEEETRLKLEDLTKLLSKYDYNQELFFGRGLRDKQATIIHHFANHDDPGRFVYPDFAAGVIMSRALINSLAARLKKEKQNSDFSIDPKYELALYIWNEGKGIALTELPELCAGNEGPQCITSFSQIFPDCGPPIGEDELFVAVKTAEKFHHDRIPVIKSTWEKDAKHIQYFSDNADLSIPTIDIGVANTEQGHCAKLMAILQHIHDDPEISQQEWVIITDDDTLLSVPRLRKFLACYAPDDPVALGERYGYAASTSYGYDYITGGGGMVLNRLAIQQVVGSKVCTCSKPDSPDDMTLGMCLKRLGIPIIHSPLFHQARAVDYATDFLNHQIPISFHKHWMIDPVESYEVWLNHPLPEGFHDEL